MAAMLGATVTLHAEAGFLPVQRSEVPAGVRKMSASVFEIFVPDGEAQIVDMLGPLPDFSDNEFKNAQMKSCAAHKLKTCAVFNSISRCSSFVAERPNQLYTALHCVHQFLRLNRDSVAFPIWVKNQSHNIVYPVSADATGATISLVNSNPRLHEDDESSAVFVINDYVKLQLQSDIGTPNQFRIQSELAAGEAVYAVGYPAPTHDRMRLFGKPDATGTSLAVTIGTVIVDSEIADASGESRQMIDAVDTNIFFSTADGQHGLSGGPFCDRQGNVVGIYIRQQPAANRPSVLTVGVRLTSFLGL